MYTSTTNERRIGRVGLVATEDGFSLTELMVVIVIIGILALLAVPRFMNVTVKAKMTEAKMMLRQVQALQTTHRFEYDRFASTLDELGFEQAPLISEGGTARYRIEIESADASSFVALATSEVDFDNDGEFNVWQVDQTGAISIRQPD